MAMIGFILVILFVIVDFFIIRALFNIIFEDSSDFYECLKLGFRPDIISLFKGELKKDLAAQFQIGIFFSLTIGLIFIEILIVRSFF